MSLFFGGLLWLLCFFLFFCFLLCSLLIHQPPHVPACNWSIWFPRLREGDHLIPTQKFSFGWGHIKMRSHCLADGKISDREDIQPLQIEHEKNIDRPLSNAPNRNETLWDIIVVHCYEALGNGWLKMFCSTFQILSLFPSDNVLRKMPFSLILQLIWGQLHLLTQPLVLKEMDPAETIPRSDCRWHQQHFLEAMGSTMLFQITW